MLHHVLLRRVVVVAVVVAAAASATPSSATPPVPPGASLLPAPDATADCPASAGPEPDWAAALTPARDTRVEKLEHWLERPDGTLLEVTVYLPKDRPGRRPTVLYATPYSSQFTQAVGQEELDGTPVWDGHTNPATTAFGIETSANGFARCATGLYLRRGYAWVTYDLRGTGDSTGCYDIAGRQEQEDGRAVVDWIAAQPWSDGTVGMTGLSLEGLAQLAVAATRPPALRAVVPVSPSEAYTNVRTGGLRLEPFPPFSGATGLPPLVRAGAVCDPETVQHVEVEEHAWFDDFWRQRDAATLASQVRVPVLLTTGNPFDGSYSFWNVWEALERAGVPRKGLVGPWGHRYPTVDWWQLHELRWFEHHLRGIDTGVMDEPRLTLLDRAGVATRRGTLPRAESALELSAGALTSRATSGSAAWKDTPGLTRPQLEADPTAHARWTSAPVARDVLLSGVPRLELTATVDAASTNLYAVLYDVAPDGARRYLSRGMLDAQLRGGLDQPPVPVPAGTAQLYALDLWPRHTVLPAGHRLQLVLSSGESCLADNTNGCAHPGVQDWFAWSVVPSSTAASVTVAEGPGLSRLFVPAAGLPAAER